MQRENRRLSQWRNIAVAVVGAAVLTAGASGGAMAQVELTNCEMQGADCADRINDNTETSAANAAASGLNTERSEANEKRSIANEERSETNEGNIATNRTDIDSNRTDINSNIGRITTNEEDISINSSDIASNRSGIAENTNRINGAFNDIDENTQGIAIAIAMGGLALPTGKNFAISANVGFYDDKSAIAAQAALRIDKTYTLNGGIGFGTDANSKVGGRIGITAAW